MSFAMVMCKYNVRQRRVVRGSTTEGQVHINSPPVLTISWSCPVIVNQDVTLEEIGGTTEYHSMSNPYKGNVMVWS